jgi:uncharacterized DUF497 family protein
MAVRFEWNARKAASNLRRHGVSFEEASTVFADPLSLQSRIRIIQRPNCVSSISVCRFEGGFSWYRTRSEMIEFASLARA